MANYGIVAGKHVQAFVGEITQADKGIQIPKSWGTTQDLKNNILRSGGMFINTYSAILILDYGFQDSRDTRKVASDFVALQDVFRSQGIRGTRLYLITKNTDLFNMLKGSVNGVSGTHYQDVEIFWVNREVIPTRMMVDIMYGKHDGKGLYNKEARELSREERLDKESKEFIEDARSIDKEILRYGVDKPVSILSTKEAVDSDESLRELKIREQQQKERETLEDRQRRERERLIAKQEKAVDLSKKKEVKTVAGISVHGGNEPTEPVALEDIVPQERTRVQRKVEEPVSHINELPVAERVGMSVKVKDTRLLTPTVERLMDLFTEAVSSDVEASDGKLSSDHGVYSFIGASHAGGSGLIANVADIYAMLGRKVLVIDLDIINRSQTLYFKRYEKSVREHKGVSNSLLKVVQGGRIENTAVSVTSRIDVLSMSRDDVVEEDWANTIGAELDTILHDAKELYDVVLVDIPFRMLGYYLRGISRVDRNIFVVESQFYNLENFFAMGVANHYEKNNLLMGDLIRKSSVVINKFRRGIRDEEGYELNYKKVKDMLDGAGSPYDSMLVAGEIPFYNDWEKQFFTGVRHIWRDELALRVFKGVFSRAIV